MARVFPGACRADRRHTDYVVDTGAPRRPPWSRIGRATAGVLTVAFVLMFPIALIGRAAAFPQEELGFDGYVWPMVIVQVAFVAVGTFIMLQPGQRVNGALFAAAGALHPDAWVGTAVLDPLVRAIVDVASILSWFLLGWVLLRYPERRLARSYERVVLAVGAASLIGCQTLGTLTADPPERTQEPVWLLIDVLNQLAQPAFWFGAAVVYAAFIVLMILRFRRTRGLDRATYRPTYVAGAALAVAGMAAGLAELISRPWYPLLALQWIALLIIPILLLYGLTRRRLARSRVADLVMQVNDATSPAAVEAALRRTMVDPELQVLFWSPDLGGYIDVRGQPATAVSADGRLALPVMNGRGEPRCLVLADNSAEHHPELLNAAVAASALALENAALHASLLARLAEVRESRTRLAETAVAERRRIERDLHDGAQQALLAVGLTLARAQAANDTNTRTQLLTQARGELNAALQELRTLATGLHPAVLTQLGLGPALEAIVERLPVPVSLTVPTRRWSEAAETTAYFIACEALSNAVKHAEATRIRVAVVDRSDRLVVHIADDGRGGAIESTVGQGLVGMRDRAAALGGALSISSPPGAGTNIVAELPCV
jgi:signal transduction histidine kinase